MIGFPPLHRRLAAAFALGLAAGLALPAHAQPAGETVAAELEPRRLELARAIIDVAYPPDRRRELLLGAIDSMTAQMRTAAESGPGPGLDAGAELIVERYLKRSRAEGERAIDEHHPALFEALARGYARQFTAAELSEVRAFVGTPAGAKYVQRSAQLLADPDVARANSAYMATVLAAIQPLQAELRRELTEYFSSRPSRQ